MRPQKDSAAPRANGQAAVNNTNSTERNTANGPRPQATFRGRRYVHRIDILGARVKMDARDEVVLDAIKRAGRWDALAPYVRNGISVMVQFPHDRTRFAVWCGNADDGGFLMYHVKPRDYARVFCVAAFTHTRTLLTPTEVPHE